ncbi:MAG: squalene--hopene cyclase [Elusimicrobia bacterium]|nr:squalene--hopene cyclase [Elusimicrobiota bacterium]
MRRLIYAPFSGISGRNRVVRRFVSEWLSPFGQPLYRKPKDWADNLKPEAGRLPEQPGLPEDLRNAIRRAQTALLKKQSSDDGYWCAELRADTTLESDTIMLLYFLGRADSPKIARLAKFILSQQLPDGGWPIFKNGPAEISATVKAYWALKFAGHAPDEPSMVKARERINALGGIHKVNTYSKFYMALFGLYDWKGVPTIPPELMCFPNWFYFNIYEMSSWTRAIVVPLSIVWAERPDVTCPPHARLDELFPDERRFVPLKDLMPPHSLLSWTSFFLWCDKALKGIEGKGPHAIRAWALRTAESWMLEHLQHSDGLGAIFPGIVNTILAMKCLGYSDHDPRLKREIEHLERLELDRGDLLEMQPCQSPVWDTAIAVIALAESGLYREHRALGGSAEWLLSKEIRVAGDWRVTNPTGPIGGWAFEFQNDWYPDIDDTAMVMLALRHVHLEERLELAREKACLRGLHWLLSMQSKSGGWAAFDKDNTKAILTKIPFADHNAMIDPPTADITGRILEFLGYVGYDLSYPCVQSAIEFIKKEQERDGSWYGRWCVNYIYGTWQMLRGLNAIGYDMHEPWIQKAANWLKAVQRPDGGWGETCATYHDPALKAKGPSTPSQTAWAIMGLMAAGHGSDPAVERGVAWLLRTQRPDGTWDETEFTGTGFPKVFYLEYTLYRDNFPVLALGQYQTLLRDAERSRRTPAAQTLGPALQGA